MKDSLLFSAFAGLFVFLLMSFTALNRSCSNERRVGRAEAEMAAANPDTAVYVSGTDTVSWVRPRFSERRQERHELVRQGIRGQGIEDEEVVEAMRQVPRHLFVPESQKSLAYLNRPLPIGHGVTISQPFIVAFMTAQLDIQPGEKVLEIGTGSGYQAAVLSELTPRVYTIEIIPELGRQARQRFDSLGYHTIKTRIGDGYKGWPGYAPFDAIILTAAAEEIPPLLIDQLAPGGVLVMPKGPEGEPQVLVRVTKNEEGELTQRKLLPVRFVPMTGQIQNR